ncbi:putative transcription factor WRKY family [Helianthus annuus]|uniref:Transcription factor WRKY family n=1 Tax=Helianthus annuus TaxID=4232 RepID=A0A9K3I563_HELAN|nr:probable WRKY transcription factor 70 [Helianthus annuus]KAF5790466.1 putative transcription factor WRKY family [Helianthus annuus]
MEGNSTTNMRKTLIGELIRGRDCTEKLQNQLLRRVVDGGPESPEDLVMKIAASFSECLSTFSYPVSTYVGSACLDKTKKKPEPGAVKDRRGCYKRKTEDSRVEITDTYEDGYAWRKYGQKEILHAKFPRCYYRCTHKDDQGCKALRQVQQLEEYGSAKYRITYIGSHTCQNMNENTQTFLAPEDHSFSLINFKDSGIKHSPSSLSTITNGDTIVSFKQHDDSNAQGGNYLAPSSQGTSSNYGCEDMITNLDLSYTDIFKDDDLNGERDNYHASSSQATSSNYVWEDMITDLERSCDDIFQI